LALRGIKAVNRGDIAVCVALIHCAVCDLPARACDLPREAVIRVIAKGGFEAIAKGERVKPPFVGVNRDVLGDGELRPFVTACYF